MKNIAFVIAIIVFLTSCGMKGKLVAPESTKKQTVIDEYWMPGKEEGDFKGILPLPPDEECVEIIKSVGPLQKFEKQQDKSQNEEQEREQKPESKAESDDSSTSSE